MQEHEENIQRIRVRQQIETYNKLTEDIEEEDNLSLSSDESEDENRTWRIWEYDEYWGSWIDRELTEE